MRVCVIVPAAGTGTRFGGDKLSQDLGGRPVLLRTIELFTARPEVAAIIVAAPPEAEELERFRWRYGARLGFLGATIVPGGRRERWETVKLALAHVPADCTHVAIHDAARPTAPAAMLDRLFEAARRVPAVIPGVAVSATLKRVGPATALPPQRPSETPSERDAGTSREESIADAILAPMMAPTVAPTVAPIPDSMVGDAALRPTVRPVIETVSRAQLVGVQTPQIFERELLLAAYAALEARGELDGVTDDAQVVERFGQPVVVVEGDARNVKVTTQDDLLLVRAIVAVTATDTSRASLSRHDE